MNIKELKNMSEHDLIMMEIWDLMKEADQKDIHAEEASADRETKNENRG